MSNRCRDRFCVPCARDRGALLAHNLAAAIGNTSVRMITLTLRTEPTCPLQDSLNRLYFSFAKLRRSVFWIEHVDGGAALLELAYSARSPRWHPHLHILAHGRYIPQQELSNAWRAATGDSYIVDIRAIPDTDAVVRYVTKYVSKPIHTSVHRSHELLCELILAVGRRRLCLTFGTWRGIRLLETPAPIDWIYVGTLADIRHRASNGDSDALKILRTITHVSQVTDDASLDPQLYDT